MDNQFDLDNQTAIRLLNTNKHYEPFNQCEETDSRMIVIGEITSIEVFMRMSYEFLNVNNSPNYGNRKPPRSSSYYGNQDEEDEDDFLGDFNNAQASTSSPSDISIVNVYRSFKVLKDCLNKNLNVLMDDRYLKPFCNLITNKDMSGRITAVALGSLLKFLNCGLIDYTENQGSAQLIGETMTRVRFISTTANSDEVVLMRILLLIKGILTRGFNQINNQTLYDMIKTCFRVIFEPNLSELLRKNAEHTLIDIVRMLFMRLDEFQDSERLLNLERGVRSTAIQKESSATKGDKESKEPKTADEEQCKQKNKTEVKQKFYDLDCIYDLFSYLAQIVNPNKSPNTLMNNQVGLNVLIVVFETAVDSIGQKASLMKIVKNELCWSLVNIIKPDKLTLYSLGFRLSSIIFLHLRMQLKYQFQEMLIKILEILSSLTSSQEYKDIAIDYLHMFFLQIPFLPHELFINYDCDPYASNILEDLLNLLSKNCYLNSKLTNIQSTGDSEVPVFNFVKRMSFNLLLLILRSLQKAELVKDFALMPNLSESGHLKLRRLFDTNQVDELSEDEERMKRNFFLPTTNEQVIYLKERKKLIWEASDNFNAKPTKGIAFLKEKMLVENNQDLIKFLRENTRLDKKELGDYLSNRKNDEILEQFVQSFNFVNLRLDDALRLFLESFRLPGEAPLISFLLEQFANHWFESNQRPFANVDSAFALSYAIIMLNTDQHNSNVRQSMTCDDFIRNLRGVNGGKDFDQEMLKSIYHAIHENKIITPAEQQGLIREKYLWKCMLTKSESYFGIYSYATKSKIENQETKSSQLAFLNASIFEILWGPSIASLTFLFDKINMNKKTGLLKTILNQGFTSCAFLCARYGHLDDLIVSLCKFTINSAGGPMNPLLYPKSQEAALCLFNITKEYANEIRESWKNIIEIILNWFKGKFLDDMFEIEDFALNGKSIKLKRKINCKLNQKNTAENSSNIFTGFFQFFSGNDRSDLDQLDSLSSRSLDDESSGKNQLKYIYEQPLSILKDSKFFHFDSLIELIKAIIAVNVEFVDELGDDVEVFKLELLFQVVFLNRDRVAVLWPQISNYLVKLLKSCETSEFLSERTISAIFRLAIRFICRPEKLSNQVRRLVFKIKFHYFGKIN